MTSELEQEFYKVFEISPATVQEYGATYFMDTIEIDGKRYTPIDDRKLLEMICILDNYGKYDCWAVTVAKLKDAILKNCIAVVVSKLLNDVILEQFKHKVQQLFKEDE